MSYQAGTASIFIDDNDESSDLLEETVDVPEYILRWQEEHRVSDEVIEQRIQSAPDTPMPLIDLHISASPLLF